MLNRCPADWAIVRFAVWDGRGDRPQILRVAGTFDSAEACPSADGKRRALPGCKRVRAVSGVSAAGTRWIDEIGAGAATGASVAAVGAGSRSASGSAGGAGTVRGASAAGRSLDDSISAGDSRVSWVSGSAVSVSDFPSSANASASMVSKADSGDRSGNDSGAAAASGGATVVTGAEGLDADCGAVDG